MKKKKVVLTMVGVMLATAFTFAAIPTSKVAVVNQSNSVYKLIYEGATVGKVTLRIYDESNNVILTETKRGLSRFILPLNFAGLEHGEYSIEITDETGTQIQKLNYAVEKSAANDVHISKLNNGKYLLSAATSGKINVQIFDGNDKLIYRKNLSVNGNLAVVYNLKNVEGQPVFLVE